MKYHLKQRSAMPDGFVPLCFENHAQDSRVRLLGHFRHVGYDGFNKALTGDTSMTVTAKRSDTHHVPCVISIAHDGAVRSFARRRIAFRRNGWAKE